MEGLCQRGQAILWVDLSAYMGWSVGICARLIYVYKRLDCCGLGFLSLGGNLSTEIGRGLGPTDSTIFVFLLLALPSFRVVYRWAGGFWWDWVTF